MVWASPDGWQSLSTQGLPPARHGEGSTAPACHHNHTHTHLSSWPLGPLYTLHGTHTAAPGCGGGDGLGAVAGGPPSCASPAGEASRKGSCLAAAFGHPQADSVWSPSGRSRAGCCCSLLTFGGLSVGLSQPGFGFSFWRQLPLVFCTYDADVWRDPPTLKALQCWE